MTTQEERKRYVKRAKELYDRELRHELIRDYEGYIVKIDGRSGEYAIGISASQSLADLKKRCQNPITYTARIGSDHVYDMPSSTVLGSSTSS